MLTTAANVPRTRQQALQEGYEIHSQDEDFAVYSKNISEHNVHLLLIPIYYDFICEFLDVDHGRVLTFIVFNPTGGSPIYATNRADMSTALKIIFGRDPSECMSHKPANVN